MVAEARDLDARLLAGLDQRDAVLDLDGRTVDDELLGHGGLFCPCRRRRSHAVPVGLAASRMTTPATSAAKPNQNSIGS